MLRVLREWGLARSAPASSLARACALHLLCRDAEFCKHAGVRLLAGLHALGDAACGCERARAQRAFFRKPTSQLSTRYPRLHAS